MPLFSRYAGGLAAIVSSAAFAGACVGDDPASGSTDSRDAGASSSSSGAGTSSSSGADGGTSSSSSSGDASSGGTSSGALLDGGSFSKGASRIHWKLLNSRGETITCQQAGGQTMQIEALPTAAGPNNLQNSACAEDATEGSVLVGNLAPDALYTTDVLLYEHLDPLADEQPIAFSATKDLDFAHGCNEIVDDTCVRDFEANVIVTTP